MHAPSGEGWVGWKIQPRYAFALEYTVCVRQLASLIFDEFTEDTKIPLLPSTTGRVGAVDPVRDDGEVGC
ncbi:MAG: hypothetical protein QOK37_4475 [Thermoanaerobaculia bacterium]|jgi:hypothetical protein|nr:hypothetical protein [Thermoanaerobaculia bacterium]